MQLEFGQQMLVGGAAVSMAMLALWLRQRQTRDAGNVDVGWSFSLGSMALFMALTSDGNPVRRVFLAAIATIWAFRLGIHILQRNRGKSEDGRYQDLRERWGPRAQFYFFLFFQAQALLVMLFSISYWVVAHNSLPLSAWDFLGLGIFVVAILGEGVADRQLERFRNRPDSRGKTCREGLWRYSRHPNYFFEWLHWWSYVALGLPAAFGWATFTGPLLMLFFLFKVTGIPATEEQALKSRGEDYRRYQESTSAFFPWFPKEERN